jgi:hypothetical protein
VKIPNIASLGRYDSCYIATEDATIPISCPARLLSERARGLRIVIVCVGGPRGTGDAGELDAVMDRLGCDYLFGGVLPGPPGPLSASLPLSARGSDEEHQTLAVFLEAIRRQARPRRLYLPLGLGGLLSDRALLEVGLLIFSTDTRDIFLYEEKPAALIPGAVRLRLAQIGASLPPGASFLPRASPLLLLIGFQRAPHLAGRLVGFGERLRTTLTLAREWAATRAWQPQRAFGPRVQPIIQETTPGASEITELLGDRIPSLFGSARRMAAAMRRHARSLGQDHSSERYWLLLPERPSVRPFVPGLAEAETQL